MQDETLKDKQIKWNKNHFSTALNRMVCMNVKHRNPLIKKLMNYKCFILLHLNYKDEKQKRNLFLNDI